MSDHPGREEATPEADALEQMEDVGEPLSEPRRHRPAFRPPPEAPTADAWDQARTADGGFPPDGADQEIPADIPEADALEQRSAEPLDDDDGGPRGSDEPPWPSWSARE